MLKTPNKSMLYCDFMLGPPGEPGLDGLNGLRGTKGMEGASGKRGTGVYHNFQYSLVIKSKLIFMSFRVCLLV